MPVEPHVKSAETRKLFNAGVSGIYKTGKSADPICYNVSTVELTGLFDIVETNMTHQYPAGGPREPVYDLMRKLGFSMARFSDKTWHSADGIKVSIFGAGSMARIQLNENPEGECKLHELSERISALRTTELNVRKNASLAALGGSSWNGRD